MCLLRIGLDNNRVKKIADVKISIKLQTDRMLKGDRGENDAFDCKNLFDMMDYHFWVYVFSKMLGKFS